MSKSVFKYAAGSVFKGYYCRDITKSSIFRTRISRSQYLPQNKNTTACCYSCCRWRHRRLSSSTTAAVVLVQGDPPCTAPSVAVVALRAKAFIDDAAPLSAASSSETLAKASCAISTNWPQSGTGLISSTRIRPSRQAACVTYSWYVSYTWCHTITYRQYTWQKQTRP